MKRWGAPVGLLLAVLTAVPAAAGGSGPVAQDPHVCAGQRWVAAWGMSPSQSDVPVLPGTVREQALTHASGTSVRLHLSNRFSPTAATIGRTTVAAQQAGAAVTASSLRTVTFAGRTSVTIPAGHEAVSDPVSLPVSDLELLDVSLWLPQGITSPTVHRYSGQTAWAAAGDHTRDVGSAALAALPSSPMYVLSGIDVLAPASTSVVVALGDSLTDGFSPDAASVLDRQARWPDVLARRLQGQGVSIVDSGITGDQVVGLLTHRAMGLSRFDLDVAQQAGVTTVVLFEGINDLSHGHSAADLIAHDKAVIARAHARHLQVLLATETPTGGILGPYDPVLFALRHRVNAWIRSQHVADGVVDFDAAVRDPARSDFLRTDLDAGDHLHLNPAGQAALGRAFPTSVLAARTCLT